MKTGGHGTALCFGRLSREFSESRLSRDFSENRISFDFSEQRFISDKNDTSFSAQSSKDFEVKVFFVNILNNPSNCQDIQYQVEARLSRDISNDNQAPGGAGPAREPSSFH